MAEGAEKVDTTLQEAARRREEEKGNDVEGKLTGRRQEVDGTRQIQENIEPNLEGAEGNVVLKGRGLQKEEKSHGGSGMGGTWDDVGAVDAVSDQGNPSTLHAPGGPAVAAADFAPGAGTRAEL